jgi:site-specific DNA recombinase
MKLILIARVSDVDQRKALPAQKLRLKHYAQSIDRKAEYYEFDESAHKDIRKKFTELVGHIKAQKEPVAVVFDKIDRYTRDSSQEEVRALNLLVKCGKIELHFPSDNLFINRNSPAADLFRLGIGVALAKYYSDSIRDNVKRRQYQMLHDGIAIGFTPTGYLNLHKGTITKPIKVIEIDPIRAPHIATIFEKRSTGMSYEAIAKLMNENGMTTKAGKKLGKSAIERMTHNPFYYGEMLYVGKLYRHNYETIISKELFDKCQVVRKLRHDQHTRYGSLPFILNGYVKCRKCGCMMSSFKARNNVYLKCSKARGECGNLNTAESLVMPQVKATIASIALSDELFNLLISEIKKRYGNQQQHLDAEIKKTREEYDIIIAQLKKLTYERLDSVKTGRGITTELFDEIVEELTNKQQDLSYRLSKLTDSNKSFLITASHLLDLGQRCNQLFKASDTRLKQEMLKFLLSNIDLYDKTLSYNVTNPYTAFVELGNNSEHESKSNEWCGSGDSNPWPRPWQGRALNN